MNQELIKLHTGKRILTIESYVSAYYGVNTRELGEKNGKYVNVFHLGLVLVTYESMFGEQTQPIPYSVYGMILNRERTSARAWLMKTKGYLDVYKKKKEEYERFLRNNIDDMMQDCNTNNSLSHSGYIKIVSNISEEQLAQLQPAH